METSNIKKHMETSQDQNSMATCEIELKHYTLFIK